MVSTPLAYFFARTPPPIAGRSALHYPVRPRPPARPQILAAQSVARTNFASRTTAEEALGRELLTLLGRSPNPSNAFHLCVQLGLMKHHENLYMREAGIEKVRREVHRSDGPIGRSTKKTCAVAIFLEESNYSILRLSLFHYLADPLCSTAAGSYASDKQPKKRLFQSNHVTDRSDTNVCRPSPTGLQLRLHKRWPIDGATERSTLPINQQLHT